MSSSQYAKYCCGLVRIPSITGNCIEKSKHIVQIRYNL